MNKQIVLIPSQMKYLQKLGVDTSDASMRYERWGGHESNGDTVEFMWSEWKLALGFNNSQNCNNYQLIPAYTLQDILEKLPKEILRDSDDISVTALKIDIIDNQVYYESCYWGERQEAESFSCDTLLESTYEMLCWCAENGHMKGGKE